MSSPRKLVIDTNVWLDWLVFDDAGIGPIKRAVDEQRAEIFIDDACAFELETALGYSLRKKIMSIEERAGLLAECRRIARPVEPATADAAGSLPRCRDKDDQKFLELALACNADYLITKDLMLLELTRRKVKRTPFGIVTPAGFAKEVRVRTVD